MRPSAPDRSSRATRSLVRAVEHGNVNAATKAIERRADANALVDFQFLPDEPRVRAPVLFLALKRGDAILLDLLLQARASLDARVLLPGQTGAGQGRTVLDVVQSAKDLMALMAAGLLLHQPNGTDHRDMVLHVAAERGWGEVIAWVARRSAAMDVRNALGQTPLHAAVRSPAPAGERWRRQVAIRELLAGGSAIDVVDFKGHSPAQTAALHCPEMLPALAQAGADLAPLLESPSPMWRPVSESVRERIDIALTLRRQRLARLAAAAAPSAEVAA